MALNIQLPEKNILKPKITVFGVGGAGGNAVNNMISSNLQGVDFVVANTDAQALENSLADVKIQLGEKATKGLGAGSLPQIGREAAEEALDEIKECLGGRNMVFVTAGMGGGTGTGAAPVIAKAARDADILTVGVVTKPFYFEGARRMKIAEEGLEQLQQYVDTLIVIPNQNLFRIANENTTFADAFKLADDVLHCGVRGVTDLMIMPGLINLDFADIRTVMREMGKAMMGTGEAEGERRALQAAEAAISNPLLDNVSMKGARGVLISITGGSDLTLFEVDEAANRIREEVDPEANIIFGSTFNEALESKIRVSVVATGIGEPFQKVPRDADSKFQVKATAPGFSAEGNQEFVNSQDAAQEEAVTEKEEQVAAAESAQKAFDRLKQDVESTTEGLGKEYFDVVQKLNNEFDSNNETQAKEWQKNEQEDGSFFVAPDNKQSGNNDVEELPDQTRERVAETMRPRESKGLFKRMAAVARSFSGNKQEHKVDQLSGHVAHAAPRSEANAVAQQVQPELRRQAAPSNPNGFADTLERTRPASSTPQTSPASEREREEALHGQDDLLDVPAFLRRKT